ncbi:hypothetical protein [Microbacterium sp. NPDC057650]|uniref:hypothetical protein n=1 Tax=unclassified Microbacterium TaxID=2609290 RepID=UPI00366DAE51
MAGRSENTSLTVVRCECGTTVAAIIAPSKRLLHQPDGSHKWTDVEGEPLAYTAAATRPDHRTVSMWKDVRAALNHIHQVEFHLGFLPEKPRGIDWEIVRLQLDDARAVLGQLANALADGDPNA